MYEREVGMYFLKMDLADGTCTFLVQFAQMGESAQICTMSHPQRYWP